MGSSHQSRTVRQLLVAQVCARMELLCCCFFSSGDAHLIPLQHTHSLSRAHPVLQHVPVLLCVAQPHLESHASD
jgi:hypothetical protein